MTISVYVDKRKTVTGEMPVKIIVRKGGDSIMFNTGLKTSVRFSGPVFPRSETGHNAKTASLSRLIVRVEEVCNANLCLRLDRLKTILQQKIFGGGTPDVEDGLAEYCERYAEEMERRGVIKPQTARIYAQAGASVRSFDNISLDEVTPSWLCDFEHHLRRNGLTINGIASKMRNIRTIMNWCREQELTTNYPFGGRMGFRIREEMKAVNNLTAQEFADLRDYPCEPWQRVYVDMFCLTVYLAGINAGDLLLCKGLTNGRLVFTRRKTDRQTNYRIKPVSLPVYPEAMEIINKYRGKKYLLNIMENRKDYHSFLQHWDRALKKIGDYRIVPDSTGRMRKREYLPVFPNLTTYSARYTFASVAANDLDVSERTIGLCLGHSWSASVTSRYISNDTKKIDSTIRKVIDRLNEHSGRYLSDNDN